MTYIEFIKYLKSHQPFKLEIIELLNPFDTERIESQFPDKLNTQYLQSQVLAFINPRDLNNPKCVEISYVLNENILDMLEEYFEEKFDDENNKIDINKNKQYVLNGKTKPQIKLIQHEYTFNHSYPNLSALMNHIRKIINLRVVPIEDSQQVIERLSPTENGNRFVMVFQNVDNIEQCNLKFFATDNIILNSLLGEINRQCFNYIRPVNKYQKVINTGGLVMADETYNLL